MCLSGMAPAVIYVLERVLFYMVPVSQALINTSGFLSGIFVLDYREVCVGGTGLHHHNVIY
jgi:hypothetical protein